MAIFAVSLTITGLLSFALIPLIPAVAASGKAVYAVMIGATVIFAFSSGMDEVLLTPIVDSIPDANSGALALMHSFYAWGQVIFVVLTSLFIVFAGEKLWYVIVLLWISIPVASLVLFIICPMAEKKEVAQTMGKTLFSPAMLLAMLAIFTAGGSEVVMNQYVSTMAQITLGFSKTTWRVWRYSPQCSVSDERFTELRAIGLICRSSLSQQALSRSFVISAWELFTYPQSNSRFA